MEIMQPWRGLPDRSFPNTAAAVTEIAVIGAGGHSKVIQDILRSHASYKVKAILDDKHDELKLQNGIYTGPIASVRSLLQQYGGMKFIVAVGNNEVRKQLTARLGISDDGYISLAHPTAVVSPSATIGSGTVVMPNAVINADAAIGRHTIINTGAIIEHDSVIGDYVHVAPKATLTGTVRAQEGSMIGAGATVIPGRTVGKWAVVGAGATVIGDIPPYRTAVGTPAKIIK